MSNRDNYTDHGSRRVELTPAPDTAGDNDLGNCLVEDEAAAWGLDLRKASYLHQKSGLNKSGSWLLSATGERSRLVWPM